MTKKTPVRRFRKDFSKIKRAIELPNLIETQKKSFENFLQAGVVSEQRLDIGLQGVFKGVFPIKDYNQTASLEFISYHLGAPRYDVQECRSRGMTYAAPMRVLVRLVVWNTDEETGSQTIRDVKEQEVYFGEIPLMTENGTFVVNGTERVIVSQLHRSPGVFFEHDKGKTHSSGKLLYSARVIPYRGSWLDFEFDAKDLVYVRIDRRRKMHVTVLLRALGLSTEEILNHFYSTEVIAIDGKKLSKNIVPDVLKFQRSSRDIKDPKSGEVLVKKDRKFNTSAFEKLAKAKINELPIETEEILNRVVAKDIIDRGTGEVILSCNEILTEEKLEEIYKRKINEISVYYIDTLNVGPYVRNTLLADKVQTSEEAVIEIYRRLRPGDTSTTEAANALFENLFFNPARYDLSRVGRLKINHKFGFDVPIEVTTLRKEDILAITKYVVNLKDSRGVVDDIDHLGNRRVRAVGELLENQYRIGLVRMERAIKERMSLQ